MKKVKHPRPNIFKGVYRGHLLSYSRAGGPKKREQRKFRKLMWWVPENEPKKGFK